MPVEQDTVARMADWAAVWGIAASGIVAEVDCMVGFAGWETDIGYCWVRQSFLAPI